MSAASSQLAALQRRRQHALQRPHAGAACTASLPAADADGDEPASPPPPPTAKQLQRQRLAIMLRLHPTAAVLEQCPGGRGGVSGGGGRGGPAPRPGGGWRKELPLPPPARPPAQDGRQHGGGEHGGGEHAAQGDGPLPPPAPPLPLFLLDAAAAAAPLRQLQALWDATVRDVDRAEHYLLCSAAWMAGVVRRTAAEQAAVQEMARVRALPHAGPPHAPAFTDQSPHMRMCDVLREAARLGYQTPPNVSVMEEAALGSRAFARLAGVEDGVASGAAARVHAALREGTWPTLSCTEAERLLRALLPALLATRDGLWASLAAAAAAGNAEPRDGCLQRVFVSAVLGALCLQAAPPDLMGIALEPLACAALLPLLLLLRAQEFARTGSGAANLGAAVLAPSAVYLTLTYGVAADPAAMQQPGSWPPLPCSAAALRNAAAALAAAPELTAAWAEAVHTANVVQHVRAGRVAVGRQQGDGEDRKPACLGEADEQRALAERALMVVGLERFPPPPAAPAQAVARAQQPHVAGHPSPGPEPAITRAAAAAESPAGVESCAPPHPYLPPPPPPSSSLRAPLPDTWPAWLRAAVRLQLLGGEGALAGGAEQGGCAFLDTLMHLAQRTVEEVVAPAPTRARAQRLGRPDPAAAHAHLLSHGQAAMAAVAADGAELMTAWLAALVGRGDLAEAAMFALQRALAAGMAPAAAAGGSGPRVCGLSCARVAAALDPGLAAAQPDSWGKALRYAREEALRRCACGGVTRAAAAAAHGAAAGWGGEGAGGAADTAGAEQVCCAALLGLTLMWPFEAEASVPLTLAAVVGERLLHHMKCAGVCGSSGGTDAALRAALTHCLRDVTALLYLPCMATLPAHVWRSLAAWIPTLPPQPDLPAAAAGGGARGVAEPSPLAQQRRLAAIVAHRLACVAAAPLPMAALAQCFMRHSVYGVLAVQQQVAARGERAAAAAHVESARQLARCHAPTPA